jgi:hypothetical protein
MAEDEPPGMVAAVTARDAPQVLRLSLIYALLGGAACIDVEHVDAAWALWRYCRASAEWLFGDATGNEIADRILQAVRDAGEYGLDRTQIRNLLNRHESGARIVEALKYLDASGLVSIRKEETGGKPRSVVRAIAATKATKATETHPIG